MRRLVFVGCNIGKDVDLAVESHDECWLFEPIEEVVIELRKRFMSVRNKLVNIVQKACYARQCVKSFNVYNTNGLSSSLGIISEESKKAYSHVDLKLIDTRAVECVNLDHFLPPELYVDTLIIDAQGADLLILKTLRSRLAAGLFGVIESECDGDGFANYSGLGDNSESAMLSYMSDFDYECERIPGRVDWNPDFKWTLRKLS